MAKRVCVTAVNFARNKRRELSRKNDTKTESTDGPSFDSTIKSYKSRNFIGPQTSVFSRVE